jgi:SPP1 family predicted phage head-tail adaptor
MKIGALRRRIRLLANAGEQPDPNTGIMGEGWQPAEPDAAKQWLPASIEPLSAREFIASAAAQARASTRIQIRYRDSVTSRMRVEDDRGLIYSIEGPPLPDRESGLEYLTLVCLQLEGAA